MSATFATADPSQPLPVPTEASLNAILAALDRSRLAMARLPASLVLLALLLLLMERASARCAAKDRAPVLHQLLALCALQANSLPVTVFAKIARQERCLLSLVHTSAIRALVVLSL